MGVSCSLGLYYNTKLVSHKLLLVLSQAVAEVDYEGTIAMLEQSQTAAYLPVEQQLAKLEALSAMLPLCYSEHKTLYR